jgi:hypothetical protein
VEIQKTCKSNRAASAQINVPQIKREIKGLKRLKSKESHSVSDINDQVEKAKQDIT